ncbi:MAG: TRAP transporter substrate-binding protein, partial [Alphaproteobacteria bacterium]
TPYADGNLHTRNIRTFIEDIQKASNGQLSVQLHSNGALLKMPEIKRGVQTGQVQVGEILLTAYANEDPLFDADALPQLVVNYAQAKRLADLQRPFIEARFARQGLSLLYMVPWPPAGLYSQEPVTSLEQLRGQRFRTFSPMTNRFAQLIGAQPTLVQAAELAQAFATGVVQAQITSAATGVDTQSWDYAKVFTPLGFSMTKNAVFISSRTLQGLSQPQQQMLRDAAAAAERRGYELSEQAAKETEATLGQRGMRVLQPSARLLEDLTRVGRTMADEWVQRAGEDGKKLLDAYRASA